MQEVLNCRHFMDKKSKTLLTKNQRLGNAMKQIRESQKASMLFVSKKLGYTSESTYCRMEHGEIENISIWQILNFCKLFECNIVHLFVLADIDIFETKINSWFDFYQSLSNLSNDEAAELIEVAHKISNKQNH
jgi:transcriptional regulator with XRE-family HTH domain